jgi:hypothetical protein
VDSLAKALSVLPNHISAIAREAGAWIAALRFEAELLRYDRVSTEAA